MRSNGSTHTLPTPEKAIATLSEDLSAVKKDIATLMRSGRRHLVGKANDGAKQLASQVRTRAVKARDSVADFASERPFTTIAISAVAGVILVGMLNRQFRR
jgi:ElaB/YqjD/DUF883 family membrane-anchored ribosome-binding protein